MNRPIRRSLKKKYTETSRLDALGIYVTLYSLSIHQRGLQEDEEDQRHDVPLFCNWRLGFCVPLIQELIRVTRAIYPERTLIVQNKANF